MSLMITTLFSLLCCKRFNSFLSLFQVVVSIVGILSFHCSYGFVCNHPLSSLSLSLSSSSSSSGATKTTAAITRTKTTQRRRRTLFPPYVNSNKKRPSSVLFYKDYDNTSSSQTDQQRVLSIPVLAQLPGSGPLLLGDELILDSPTPMQWLTLEKSIDNHERFLKEKAAVAAAASAAANVNDEKKKEDDDDDDNNDDGENVDIDPNTVFPSSSTIMSSVTTTGIDAAPLVAIIDDATSSQGNTAARYATIAAAVGMSSERRHSDDVTDDDANFIESSKHKKDETVLDAFTTASSLRRRKVRLVGIGRAQLSRFVYQLPTSVHEEDKEEEKEHDDDEEDDRQTPILVAEFHIIKDSDHTSDGRSSPVHAINEMSSWIQKISSLHEDRQKLVRGLKAAKTRLMLSKEGNDPILEDFDGIGMITQLAYKEGEQQGGGKTAAGAAAIEEEEEKKKKKEYSADDRIWESRDWFSETPISENHFRTYKREENEKRQNNNNNRDQDKTGGSAEALASASALGEEGSYEEPLLQSEFWKFCEKENYGMGYTSSAVSSILDITTTLEDKLSPYYSPMIRSTEEYYYEVSSFAAMLSLQKCLEAPHFAWALQCTNSIERLQQAYEWMYHHKVQLEQAVEVIRKELQACGEDSTDLW